MMDFLNVPASSDSPDGSLYGEAPVGSSRRTAHTGNQNGLGYGVVVVWTHLRPFIPFFLISSLVVALIYLLQSIIYGGPFADPLFFVKFNERWPRPDLNKHPAAVPLFSPIPTSPEQDPFDVRTGNGTI